jgi:hypothetical protein
MATNRMAKYIDNVVLQEIKTAGGVKISSKRAVVDQDTGNVLGVVSPRYKIIKNSELLKVVRPTIEELKLNPDPMISSSRGGAITYFKFLGEKRVQGEVAKGDIVQFGVEFFNSYDGSTPIGFHIIAMRLVCTNGLVVPKSIKEIFVRHTSDATVGQVRDSLADFFPKTTRVIELWKHWAEIVPKRSQLDDSLKGIVSQRDSKMFLERYDALKSKDKNAWQFYNLFTYHTSHELKAKKQDRMALKQFELNERFVNRMATVFNGVDAK